MEPGRFRHWINGSEAEFQRAAPGHGRQRAADGKVRSVCKDDGAVCCEDAAWLGRRIRRFALHTTPGFQRPARPVHQGAAPVTPSGAAQGRSFKGSLQAKKRVVGGPKDIKSVHAGADRPCSSALRRARVKG